MFIVPVNLRKGLELRNFTPMFGKIPVRKTDSISILEQLDLLDLSQDLYVYSASLEPNTKIGVHKDYQYPVKWSLLIPPTGNDNVELEIVAPKPGSIETSVLTPVGSRSPSYKDEDCQVIESWNLKYSPCYFNPTDLWHRAVNLCNRPQVIFSLRSSTIDIDKVLSRIT